MLSSSNLTKLNHYTNLIQTYTIKIIFKNIFGMVLTIPEFRKSYINTVSYTQRYFVIEHYFSDDVLEQSNMKGESILQDVPIFEIKGNKNNFSVFVEELVAIEFTNFSLLFDNILQLFNEIE
jgi:hypothetical protein